MVEFMRNSDAFTWAMEHDPRLRSTVVTILRLERSPDWDLVRDRHERIARELVMFRQRVVESPPPAPPRWEDDPDFDLDLHLRRVDAPEPRTFATVLAMAAEAEMTDFDRTRPLWEATLVEGLENGEAALLYKLHHSLTDGVGGVDLALILLDAEAEADRGPLPPAPVPGQRSGALDGIRDVARYDAGLVRSLATTAVRSGPRALRGLVTSPRRSLHDAAAMTTSVYRTVRPISATGSPLMKERSLQRHLAVHEVPLEGLKAAAHRAEGSLNDAFLAGIAGGLRRYHELHGVKVQDLHVCMPVSLRSEGDPPGGNRITLMRFDLAIDVVDPRARMRAIHPRAAIVRSEPSLPYTQLIAGVLNLVPRWYIGSILRHVDFLASNVPGIPVPVFLGGARVLMQYPFGPTIGSAVNVTLLSYVDTCALGITIDTGAIPDVEAFLECLVAGFDEVLEADRTPA